MYFANAYPDSAISAGAMTAIALVAVLSLGCWLVLVFLAARKGGKAGAVQHPVVTPPGRTAEDEHGEAGLTPADPRHRTAA
jgi:hypothetical protein